MLAHCYPNFEQYSILGHLLLSQDHRPEGKATVLNRQVFAQMIMSVVASVSHGPSDYFSSSQACPAKSPRTATCDATWCIEVNSSSRCKKEWIFVRSFPLVLKPGSPRAIESSMAFSYIPPHAWDLTPKQKALYKPLDPSMAKLWEPPLCVRPNVECPKIPVVCQVSSICQ